MLPRRTVVMATLGVLPIVCLWSSSCHTILQGVHAWVTSAPRPHPRTTKNTGALLLQLRQRRERPALLGACRSSGQRRAADIKTSSPLQDFDAALDERLTRADPAGIVLDGVDVWSPAVVVYNNNNNNNTVVLEDSMDTIILPRTTFTEVLSLAFRDATSAHDFRRRHELAHSIHVAGGFVGVHLDDPGDAQTVQGAWDCINQLFGSFVSGKSIGDDGDDDEAQQPQEQLQLRHQTLTRENTAEAHKTSGYEFVQTSSNDDSLARLRQMFGTTAAQQAERSYTQCLVLARAVAVVVYAGHYNVTPAVATDFVNQLLDEDDRPNAGAYQRLCLYKDTTATATPTLDETGIRESLRSHCDWTLTTPIPRSRVPGLELYSPVLDAWICPEEPSLDDSKNKNNSIVVLTGKWMELVTAGSVQACIHRVVVRSRSTGHRRRSSPFFLRPRPAVFDATEALGYDEIDHHNNYNHNDTTKNTFTRFHRNGTVPAQVIARHLHQVFHPHYHHDLELHPRMTVLQQH